MEDKNEADRVARMAHHRRMDQLEDSDLGRSPRMPRGGLIVIIGAVIVLAFIGMMSAAIAVADVLGFL